MKANIKMRPCQRSPAITVYCVANFPGSGAMFHQQISYFCGRQVESLPVRLRLSLSESIRRCSTRPGDSFRKDGTRDEERKASGERRGHLRNEEDLGLLALRGRWEGQGFVFQSLTDEKNDGEASPASSSTEMLARTSLSLSESERFRQLPLQRRPAVTWWNGIFSLRKTTQTQLSQERRSDLQVHL